ncbi:MULTISPECIES: dihydrolipoyl dehydrogenase family protein [unclassified Streptomyces]|uniref:dihydrolipoyl dehydrogenase family protein n=1 Tax=unclassified Streptomyces TaxID=2593676 RepID=UPI002DDC3E85|nr:MULTISPECIES: NAD(P)/FAD-dependent oxidoreductase [unclassified Streptomyces]WSF81944.1 NAD(P)/FAD-dependent oxidoreductase [Streptomyces sp. NBC_01744]WSC34314.1 NAD(P)/FAD-dependent oxidoreductase [Streptomyces sp. NBC_01763]WSC41747.1 NAD(P)/FAD-dependent oxidoreductase [Streptomyces sp. NBC_01763]WSC51109.1 NAD(P)/FAD-dependent oxidoreductase [Streptomyces sp. NBC_01761]WSC58413.1 NAD(P)/FAD-dependent oxidoreductase [Streptomyces sp. NBC_01761]
MNETTRTYDVVVIGAGPVGENVAERARAAGLSTVIVERELLGGECSFWACDPSKALLRPVVARADARRVPGLGQAVAGPLDVEAVLAHRDKMSSYWKDEDQVDWLDSVDVDLIRGHGRLTGPKQVAVQTPDGETVALTVRHAVVVSTGTGTALPPIPGLDTVRPWTSREATSAGKVPGRLAVVGGGVVAVEMATAWQALGSRVTMLVLEDALLQRMEPFAGELVADGLREAGVDIRFETSVTSLAREGGEVRITLADGGHLAADEILLATGRAPRTWDLGLETIGLTPGDWLKVDDTFRVTDVADGWFYAVGDVNHRALMTHQGKYQARIAGAVIGARANGEPVDDTPWGAHVATADHSAVPQVVFTTPEVASVGLTSREAEQSGRRIEVVDYDLAHIAGAHQYGEDYRGHARMLIDTDRNTVVGVTFAGPGVGELVHSATIAVAGEVPLDRLWHAVPAFPTLGEIWLRLLETHRG